jgi:SAM-dependent methyltransferase
MANTHYTASMQRHRRQLGSVAPIAAPLVGCPMMPDVPAQTWDPATCAANARFVSDLGEPLVHLLQPRPGERILDVGCGDGALTEKLARTGCRVLGVDASEAQVRAARDRGLEAEVCRIEDLPFAQQFDAVFSNAVLHWVRDQPAALDRIRRALKAGGRFVAEFGGFGCVNHIRQALHAEVRERGDDPWAHDPWYFPTAEAYGALLKTQGFDVESIALFPRPTPLPGEMAGWLLTFAQPFLRAIPEPERPAFVERVSERLRPALFEEGRGWIADYVRLRFRSVARE